MTCADVGTPHAAALAAANPHLPIRTHTAPGSPDAAEKLLAWRNCDRNIRDFWRANRADVAEDRLIFAEYDVFANVDVAATVSTVDSSDCLAAAVMSPLRDGRSWPVFAESSRMPAVMRHWLAGVVPLGLLMLSREALDELADSRHDEIFAADVFCELRLPTILRAAGFRILQNPAWSDVTVRHMQPPSGFRGIMHAVKKEVLP